MVNRSKLSDLPYTYVPPPTQHWQGEMVGEVTQTSALMQARLTKDGKLRWGDIPGDRKGGAFAISARPDMSRAVRTAWQIAQPEQDYIIRAHVVGLQPNTRYYMVLLSGEQEKAPKAGAIASFQTLAEHGTSQDVRFAVVSCMNDFAFDVWPFEFDKKAGFPTLDAIRAQQPQFIVFTGDNVYYDSPAATRAKTLKAMRAKWHCQFRTQRFAELFQAMPAYWQKDDHDYRFNDADPHIAVEPSHELGWAVFREQVPVVDPDDAEAVTYRTHRINDLLQIWLLEGRDYRDPNEQIPGPTKTIWGQTQKEWLQQTLQESDAVFKVVISPTPLIGPDDNRVEVQGGLFAPLFGGDILGSQTDNYKRDNHTNVLGFKQEAEFFFKWLTQQGFQQRNLFFVCGDRHWQYHSIHPNGFEELSCGALNDANARTGPAPGDPESTDPDGTITQPYLQPKKSGGFLTITARSGASNAVPCIVFDFFDERGQLLYKAERWLTDETLNAAGG